MATQLSLGVGHMLGFGCDSFNVVCFGFGCQNFINDKPSGEVQFIDNIEIWLAPGKHAAFGYVHLPITVLSNIFITLVGAFCRII